MSSAVLYTGAPELQFVICLKFVHGPVLILLVLQPVMNSSWVQFHRWTTSLSPVVVVQMTWMQALGLGRRGHPCGLNWGLLIMFDCGIKRLYSSLCLNESVRSENCYLCSSSLLFLSLPPQAAMCRWVCVCRLWFVGSGFRMLCCPTSLPQPGSVPPLWWALGPPVQQGLSHPLPRGRMWVVQGMFQWLTAQRAINLKQQPTGVHENAMLSARGEKRLPQNDCGTALNSSKELN